MQMIASGETRGSISCRTDRDNGSNANIHASIQLANETFAQALQFTMSLFEVCFVDVRYSCTRTRCEIVLFVLRCVLMCCDVLCCVVLCGAAL